MALGDKGYNYNFYGYPSGRTWDTEDDVGTPIAFCTRDNIATYYVNWTYIGGVPVPSGYKPDYEGKPFDKSIALWLIPANATYSTRSLLNINPANTLDYELSGEQFAEPVPVAMAAVDTTGADGPLYRDPYKRYAYNICYDIGLGYGSAFLSDIDYSKFCLYPRVYIFRKNDSNLSPYDVSAIKNYINADPNNRDVCIIRQTMYRGTVLPRKATSWDVAQDTIAYRLPRKCSPVLDTLTDLPIPGNAAAIKEGIKNGNADHIDDRTYAPFFYDCNYPLYSTGTTSTARMHDIGMFFTRTVNNVRNGSYDVTNTSPIKRTSATISRYNSIRKDFDDVSYHWDFQVRYKEGGILLNNGDDLSSLTGSHTVYFMTLLVIDDYKDAATKGEAIYRAVLHEIAYLGLYFTDTESKAQNTNFLTDDLTGVFCPIFDNGTTTGLYATGEAIKQLPNWDADTIDSPAFQYNPEGDAGGYDIGDFQSVLNSGAISAGTIYYAVSDTEFKDLVRYLNTTYNPDEDQLAADFKGVNPFDYITSVKYYPFPLPYAVSQAINVGPLATGVTGYIMPYTYGNPAYSYFDFGSYTFTPRYGNFLDYSATKITLYLPWCGSMQLDPALWIAAPGYPPITIKVKYSFDYVTGSVTAFIFRCTSQGDFLFNTADGQAGIDVPLSLYATGTYQQQIMQAQASYKQAAGNTAMTGLGLVGALVGTAVSAAVGFVPGVVGGLGGIGTSLHKLNQSLIAEDAVSYTLDHTQPTLGNVSAASPFNAAITDQRPFILISRPKLQPGLPINWEADYAHTVGYACTVPMQLSQARGFTVVQSSKLEGIKKTIGTQTFTPTKQEIQMIKQQLAAGVIF